MSEPLAAQGSPRPLLPCDAKALLPLLQTALIHDCFNEALLQEKIWGDHRFDPELALALGPAAAPIAFIIGVVRTRNHEAIGVVKLMAVADPYLGCGLGRTLLAELELRFQQRGVLRLQLGSSPPNYLWPGVDPRYERALRFFEAAGYSSVGSTCNLSVDLSKLAALSNYPLENGIEIRRARPEDCAALDLVLREHWPAWIPELAVGFSQVPISIHLGLRAGVILGFAAHDCNNLGTGFFGPMGTVPAARGLGLGRVLLRLCLQDLAEQGHEQATISWVGPVSFYEQAVGARHQRNFQLMEKQIRSV